MAAGRAITIASIHIKIVMPKVILVAFFPPPKMNFRKEHDERWIQRVKCTICVKFLHGIDDGEKPIC